MERTMQDRRSFIAGLLVAGVAVAQPSRAQPYPPPPYEGERRYLDGRGEDDENRRFEEQRRAAEERRREYYDRQGRPPGVVGLEEERNRRVLGLQLALQRGEISRREFNERVAEIDYDLHRRLGQ